VEFLLQMFPPLVSYCVPQQNGLTFYTEVSIVNFVATLRTGCIHVNKYALSLPFLNPNISVHNRDKSVQ